MARSILFVVDHSNLLRLVDGQEPYAAYSHVFNVFCMAHEAARMGWPTYIKPYNEESCFRVLEVYPTLKLGPPEDFSDPKFQPDIIVGVFVQYLVTHRCHKPGAVGAIFYPAHHWLESKTTANHDYVDQLRLAAAYDLDFAITQNPRMQDLCAHLFALTAKWMFADRILCAPIGYVPEQIGKSYNRALIRRKMGLNDDDIAIINSGGPWDWTDIETFLHGFVQAVRAGATRLKFYQMGLRQKDNSDHAYTDRVFRKIIHENPDLLGKNLIIIEEWERASTCLPDYNYGADIGINISKDSAENYQSHRVRFIEYIKAGLPVLNTEGDYMGTYAAKEACLLVRPGDPQSYKNILLQLNDGEIDLHELHKKAVEFRATLASNQVYPPILETMKENGRINRDERRTIEYAYKNIYDNFEFSPPLNGELYRNRADGNSQSGT